MKEKCIEHDMWMVKADDPRSTYWVYQGHPPTTLWTIDFLNDLIYLMIHGQTTAFQSKLIKQNLLIQ